MSLGRTFLTFHLYAEHSIPLVVRVRFSGTTCASSTAAREGCRDIAFEPVDIVARATTTRAQGAFSPCSNGTEKNEGVRATTTRAQGAFSPCSNGTEKNEGVRAGPRPWLLLDLCRSNVHKASSIG